MRTVLIVLAYYKLEFKKKNVSWLPYKQSLIYIDLFYIEHKCTLKISFVYENFLRY